MKRLKNIEGKSEEELKAIEFQGERQLDAIEEQNKNQLKMRKDDRARDVVYLREGIERLFESYPKSFNS